MTRFELSVTNGSAKLQEEFKIKIRDYPDRIVLNYDQIESPRFDNISDECRSLILKKGTWDVLSQAFVRFYNLSEGIQTKDGDQFNKIRLRSNSKTPIVEEFDLLSARIETKVDGSIISMYYDGDNWCVATRSTAFGEAPSTMGRTFKELFESSAEYKSVVKFREEFSHAKDHTWIFELTSPESRVVTPFADTNITLIGGRNNTDGSELNHKWLAHYAEQMGVKRPEQYEISSYEELISIVNEKPWMDEGVVLVFEQVGGSHNRIKVKNPKFVAVSHMRENGNLSMKNVLRIILTNEQEEYIKYFKEDKKFFDFVNDELEKVKAEATEIFDQCKGIESQKDFALSINGKVSIPFLSGILFAARKKNVSPVSLIMSTEPKKLSDSINLKERFRKHFSKVVFEE